MKPKVAISIEKDNCAVQWHYATGQVESLQLGEGAAFNWVRGRLGLPSGMCYLDKRENVENGVRHVYEYMVDLRLTVDRTLEDGVYVERYVWQNVGKKPVEIAKGDVGVYVTFAEQYDIREVTLHYRAYTHALVAGDTFYVYNAKASGEADGVGLVMTAGEVDSLVEERLHPKQRGDLIVTMPPCTLQPDETREWSWRIFAYRDRDAFWQEVQNYAPKIEIVPQYPEVGQAVTVKVDSVEPAEVMVDGTPCANPFAAPKGDFVLQPIVDRPATAIRMAGVPHVVRWADSYRGWGKVSKSERDLVAESVAYAALSDTSGDPADRRRAVEALARYYRGVGAMRHPQAFMPAALIREDMGLRAQFARHVEGILRAKPRLYTRQTVLAQYSMLSVACKVFEGKYEAEKEQARQNALPLIDAPMGVLLVGDDIDILG